MTVPFPPKRRLWYLAVPIAMIAAGAVFLWWFFGRPVPEEASLDAAAAVTTTAVPGETANEGSTASVATGGTWTVDTAIGEFSFEAATSTFAGFRVNEELSGIGSAVAVGRTPDVTGILVIQDGVVTTASIEVDLTTIVSNESRRDSRVQRALNTSQHPSATFVLDEPIPIGGELSKGETFSVDAAGELTINGITSLVTIPLEGTFVDGSVLLAGGIDITFADFGVQVPSAPVVLSAEDHGILEVQLWFSKPA
jgi:polyisoprenoid-binding protein YceI